MTFPRVSRRGRHFANVGDVIIYPDLVVARTVDCWVKLQAGVSGLESSLSIYKLCVLCFEINGLYTFLSFHFAVTSVYISIKW